MPINKLRHPGGGDGGGGVGGHMFHDTFQARGPIQGSGRPMGLVPYMSLMHVWDQSHVLLQDYCGTDLIKYIGL